MLFDLVEKKNMHYYMDMVPERMRTLLIEPDMVAVGVCDDAEDGALAVGILLVSVANPKQISVEWIYVLPSYRSYDFGTMLLYQAFDLAKEMKRETVCVRLTDPEVENFFLARGFVRRGTPADQEILLVADADAMKSAEASVEAAEAWEAEQEEKEIHFPKRFRVKSVEYFSGVEV